MLDDIIMKFGGNTVLNGLTCEVTGGMITGLIGPNGAGKTTAINIMSGFLQPYSGKVVADGRDLTKKSAAARARIGIGRTFQQVQLCEESTVEENLFYAKETLTGSNNIFKIVIPKRGDKKYIEQRIESVMDLCSMSEVARVKVKNLSTGQRRLVEIARLILNDYKIFLLDEPAAGLNDEETAALGRLLLQLVEGNDLGMLLVEHDMSLVMKICRKAYVLDFGALIFEGDAEEVFQSPDVQEAYLGVGK